MNIYYTNETLYINIEEILDESGLHKLRKRLFRILEDYGIMNVELSINNDYIANKYLLDDLLEESVRKYRTNIKIK